MKFISVFFSCCTAVFLLCVLSGCSVDSSKAEVLGPETRVNAAPDAKAAEPKGATIEIAAGSPSETVRAFYTKLREKKFREAIFLTNLRPAIESLTDDELKEFAVDFEAVARSVPAEVEINGEIISGDTATVTAKLPGGEGDKLELQQIRLRKQGDLWIILSADDTTEKVIQKEGKNYFLNLRIDTHHEEAKSMLERIAKAEMVYALQNKGEVTDFNKLILEGLLPADVTSSQSTGYNYILDLSADKKSYGVSATPAVYGKSGKLSFRLVIKADGKPHVESADRGGKPLGK